MARYAQIEVFFWNDPDVRALSLNQRYLYLWTFTNMRCGITGLYPLDLGDALHETGMKRRPFDGAWEGLVDSGKVEYDPSQGVLWVRGKFTQAIKPSRRNQTKAPSPLTITGAFNELQELKATHLIAGFWLKYQQFFEGLACPYDGAYEGVRPVTVSVAVSVPEAISKENSTAAPSRAQFSLTFDAFWTIWRQTGRGRYKQEAFKEWKKLGFNDKDLAKPIIDALIRQLNHKDICDGEGNFCPDFPDPHRWLGKRRWEDEVPG